MIDMMVGGVHERRMGWHGYKDPIEWALFGLTDGLWAVGQALGMFWP